MVVRHFLGVDLLNRVTSYAIDINDERIDIRAHEWCQPNHHAGN